MKQNTFVMFNFKNVCNLSYSYLIVIFIYIYIYISMLKYKHKYVYSIGENPVKINLENLKLKPGEGLVFKLIFDLDPNSNLY